MKKIIFATMAMIALASCSKSEVSPQIAQDGLAVSVAFDKAGGRFDTRAFFDATAEAEPYEKEVKSAVIYVFDSQGKSVMRKVFSTSEVENLSATLVLPGSVAGEECTFYAVANYANYYRVNLASESELLESPDWAASYNGAFELTSVGQMKNSGFIMSDTRKAVVQPQGTPTNVSFVLKRTVAKVAVKVSVDESLAQRLGNGKVTVDNIKVSNVPTLMAVFANITLSNVTPNYSYVQKSATIDDAFCNLFYLPELPPSSGTDRALLHIVATFDQDGYSHTTDDQIPLEWDIWIDGTGNGEIKRNGYYRIGAVIRGLTDALEDIRSSIVVADWETPITQPVVNLE